MRNQLLYAAQLGGASETSSDAEIEEILERCSDNQLPFIDELLELNMPKEIEFFRHLAEQLNTAFIEEPTWNEEELPQIRQKFPAELAIEHRFLPLSYGSSENNEGEGKRLRLAHYNPFDLIGKQKLASKIEEAVDWVICPRRQLLDGLRSLYGVGADTFQKILAEQDTMGLDYEDRDEANIIDATDEEASVVKFVNQIIREAILERATDIHLEPLEDKLRIRYRIDGLLREVPVPEDIRSLQSSVLTRLKVMSKLDIAEKRLPQDGRIHLSMNGEPIDVRVATIPSVEGESISLRLLARQLFSIPQLGLNDTLKDKLNSLLAEPNGIILVTGPTGCGKSTTLYSCLSSINSEDRRIVTIEDPVEHKLPGVVQIGVKADIGMTFASSLRSILRGDPNVIMVGEIRDLETTEIAIRSSLTGHLVLSTLHTNDSIGGITRLMDMGVEPFLLSSSIRCIIAQRLVRKLCEDCKIPDPVSDESLRNSGMPNLIGREFYQASHSGCERCRNTGYHGRIAIYEFCEITPGMSEMITQRASHRELLRYARSEGFRSMKEYGTDKVMEGITSLAEVLAATPLESMESGQEMGAQSVS